LNVNPSSETKKWKSFWDFIGRGTESLSEKEFELLRDNEPTDTAEYAINNEDDSN
jgi:hypothetical protein